MPLWTKERKEEVLRNLAGVNEALAEALKAAQARKPAETAENILSAVASKHAAVDKFPPIPVGGGVSIAAGALFREWSNKELFVNMALTAGADPAANHTQILDALQRIAEALLDKVVLAWKNTTCADRLRKLEKEVRALKALLKSGVGQVTPAQRRVWWQTIMRIRILQGEFLDCVYGDATHGISTVFLGLIDLDTRFADMLDALAEWERRIEEGTEGTVDSALYLRNMLSAAKETKEELEELIRHFSF